MQRWSSRKWCRSPAAGKDFGTLDKRKEAGVAEVQQAGGEVRAEGCPQMLTVWSGGNTVEAPLVNLKGSQGWEPLF